MIIKTKISTFHKVLLLNVHILLYFCHLFFKTIKNVSADIVTIMDSAFSRFRAQIQCLVSHKYILILFFTHVMLPSYHSLAVIHKSPTIFPLFNKDQNNEVIGNIKLNDNEHGIIVSGIVNNIIPNWPTSIEEMSLKDHIEIWLTDVNDMQLPPVGWGHQFGYKEVNKAEDCLTIFPFAGPQGGYDQETVIRYREECKKWYQEQLLYRHSFQKLFLRQWQLAPNMAREIYAFPEFQLLDKKTKTALAILEPAELPKIKFLAENIANSGYKFQFLIPWNLFPPMQSLQIRDVKIRVDIFHATNGNNKLTSYSTISAIIPPQGPELLNLFSLSVPREYLLTQCKYNLAIIPEAISRSPENGGRYPTFSENAKTYYLPSDDKYLKNILLVDNPTRGYQTIPDIDSKSPVLYAVDLWDKKIGFDIILCGPKLAILKHNKIVYSDFISISSDLLEFKDFDNKKIILKKGPNIFYSYYGSGEGGANPRMSLNMFSLDKNNGKINSLLEELRFGEEEKAFNVTFTPDWRRIDISVSPTRLSDWENVSYCLHTTNLKYGICPK